MVTPTNQAGAQSLEASQQFGPNHASYYGLNIPVSMGKRAILGVPIFAGPVRVEGRQRFIDWAVSFGEPGVPEAELIDTKITKLWINGELVEELSIVDGWNTSGALDYVLYSGSQTQLPDPRMAEILGPGQTPGFRGLTYLMFYDFPLHQFSADFSLPFVRAEMVDLIENTVRVQEFSISSPAPDGILSDQVIIPNWERNHVYMFQEIAGSPTEYYVIVIDLTTNLEISRNRILETDGSAPTDTLHITSSSNGAGQLEPSTGLVLSSRGTANTRPLFTLDPYTGTILDTFGTTGIGIVDTLTSSSAHRFRGPVSRSDTMQDRLMCTAGLVSEQVGFWRISETGQIEPAYIDKNQFLGNLANDGEVIDITAGDKITTKFKGFGTALVARRDAIYRMTIQEGSNTDGDPIDVETNSTPLHLPPVTNVWGGTTSQAYVDVTELFDVTNGTSAPTADVLQTGQPSFSLDLSDAGDLSASALDDRVVAYIKYASDREFRNFFINTRVLDGLHTGGVADYDIVVSDNGTDWTLISDFNVLDTEVPVWVGSNAPAAMTVYTPTAAVLAGESFYSGAPFSPLPSGTYVGYALKQKNYTNGSVSAFTPWAGGRDGLSVNDGDINYPDLLVPHMIKLWDVPPGHLIQMMFLEPKSEDIIVFFSEDDSAGSTGYVARLKMIEDVKGQPIPAETNGLGTTEQYVEPLVRQMDNWNLLRHAWNSSDLTGETLAVASTISGSPANKANFINVASGHQTLSDFGPDWRFAGGADEAEPLDMQERQVWSGAGMYLISQWGDDISPEFGPSKLLPFQTEVTGYPLSDLLRWMSLRVGYTADQIDTSSITDDVIGAILLERVPFRDLMANIGAVYDFDVFESEGKIKFAQALKGMSFVVNFTLTPSDLAPIEGGEALEPNDPAAEATRDPVDQKPGAVELTYLDITTDYQTNTAFARRTRFPINTTGNIDVEPLEFAVPIIMVPADALLRSTRLLYRAWNDTSNVEYRVPTAFLTMEPADIVIVPIDGQNYTVKNLETLINGDHSVSVRGETVSSEEIDETAAQSPLEIPQDVGGPSASDLYWLDIPPLNTADAQTLAGQGLTVYSAVVSKGQGSWTAARLFFKQNTPEYNVAYTTGDDADASGVALGTLPKGVESTQDFKNTLRVLFRNLDPAEFATITDQEILDGGNLCAYGKPGRWEIIQVQTVTQVSGLTYDLTNIVRGLYGTEAYSAQHALNDQFILLDRPPVRPDAYATLDQVGENVLIKAVGAKQDEANIVPEGFRLSGAFERMFPPTNLAAQTSGSDIQFTWDRRSKLTGDWIDEVEEVPIEDTFAGYELEIYVDFSDTPIRTITGLTQPEYLYLNADITADFPEVPSVVRIRVYQMSTEVGRGLPEQKELDVLP